MSQGEPGIELDTSLGYMLKAAASALHSALKAVLRPHGMTITHYSCLELLAQRPGLSNSELARGAFVTRQSMNVLLQALERQGLVARPDQAPVGRVLPTELTAAGRRQLEVASAAIRCVEHDMLAGLDAGEQDPMRQPADGVHRRADRSARGGDVTAPALRNADSRQSPKAATGWRDQDCHGLRFRARPVGQDWPSRTPFSTLSPRFLSTFFQYWKARCRTGSVTPLSRWPVMLLASRSRAASSITSRTRVPG